MPCRTSQRSVSECLPEGGVPAGAGTVTPPHTASPGEEGSEIFSEKNPCQGAWQQRGSTNYSPHYRAFVYCSLLFAAPAVYKGAASIFTIDENTGDIHATKRLDREAQAYYTLHAQAVDRVTNQPVEPRSEFVVKVQDINDNEPKFLDGPYMAGVPEMSPLGTMVVQVAATDADDPTYGNSARVIYSIIHGQPYFSVEPRTGRPRSLRDLVVIPIMQSAG
ncbi:unnamed protein product [Arctogadus glacialis]